jgi:hypothetical protein
MTTTNATNVTITKNNNENSVSLLKRFTRKVQEYGIIPRVKMDKYEQRALSPYKMKKIKLKKLEGEKVYNLKKKMGKIIMKPRRFGSSNFKKPENKTAVKTEVKVEAPKA